ncbi:metal-dependent transcriptional regulator [Demequina pelophila]|uniref:metal-dependent transcriptional regulator n=1 Tax=Demequina pelophila TaxID=1638984 RepID=UPI00078494D9|nr:metal-dependent transcriptional regulator [Demequina pelophila]
MDEAELSATAQDYVKVVWSATEWTDTPVTTKFLSQRLNVSAPTVSENVRKLVTAGLLEHEPYGAITLTREGERRALQMVRRHRIIETFLVTQLRYGWDEVHDEAEVLEHACSARLIDALDGLLGHPRRDPHGDPIPSPAGEVDAVEGVNLAAAAVGRWVVTRVSDADPEVLRELAALGVVVDARLTVLRPGEDGSGPRIEVDGGAPLDLPAPAASAVWLLPEARA